MVHSKDALKIVLPHSSRLVSVCEPLFHAIAKLTHPI